MEPNNHKAIIDIVLSLQKSKEENVINKNNYTMANYPKELIDLVQEYLTDGVISTKERQVLLNKAQKLGIDVDEFDLYIDAQQQKSDQQVMYASRERKGKTCPFCGASVPSFTDKCPECGNFITPEAGKELEEIIENLEDALVDLKSGYYYDRSKATVERYSRKARLYYSNHPKIRPLLDEVEREMIKAASNIKREKLFSITFKNKWFWIGLVVFVALIISLIGFYVIEDDGLGMIALYVAGFVGIFGSMGAAGLIKPNE